MAKQVTSLQKQNLQHSNFNLLINTIYPMACILRPDFIFFFYNSKNTVCKITINIGTEYLSIPIFSAFPPMFTNSILYWSKSCCDVSILLQTPMSTEVPTLT